MRSGVSRVHACKVTSVMSGSLVSCTFSSKYFVIWNLRFLVRGVRLPKDKETCTSSERHNSWHSYMEVTAFRLHLFALLTRQDNLLRDQLCEAHFTSVYLSWTTLVTEQFFLTLCCCCLGRGSSHMWRGFEILYYGGKSPICFATLLLGNKQRFLSNLLIFIPKTTEGDESSSLNLSNMFQHQKKKR